MSRRSRQRRKVLRQCGGDRVKFAATRPTATVKGTGRWRGAGSGVGATVTLPENPKK